VVLEKDGEDQLGAHMRNEEVLLRVKEQRNILHEISGRLTGLVTFCVETAFCNGLLKER
jgi:hypothetical protein